MRKHKFKWLFVFLYLNLALMFVFPLWFMLVQVGTEFFYSLYYAGKFSVSNIDFIKAIKAGLFCGGLAGSGCWWIYYQHHRKNRNR